MTKKSAGRLAKDRQKAELKELQNNNTCYDELNAIHQQCAALLLQHTGLSEAIKNKPLVAAIKDPEVFMQNIRLLAADLTKLHQELQEISKQHEGKTGGSRDPEELMKTVTIAEQYNLFMQRHNATVSPTAQHIIEQIAIAEQRLAGAMEIIQAEDGLTNPEVVSDVSFTDVPVSPKQD